jgi:hypothetical protein
MLEGILDFPHLLVSVHGADVLIGMSPSFEDPILLYERQTSYPTAIGHRFFMALAHEPSFKRYFPTVLALSSFRLIGRPLIDLVAGW